MSNRKSKAVPGPSNAKNDAVPSSSKAKDDAVTGPSNTKDDAVPGPSHAKDDTVPGPSNAKDDAVPGPSNAKDDAVPGPSNAKDDSVPGPSNAKDDTVPGPSNAKDDAVPGPSNAKDVAVPGPSNAKDDPKPSPTNKEDLRTESSSRKVTFSQEALSASEERRSKHRRSSMIGTAGYVAQLVEEIEKDKSEDEEDRTPIRIQSISERRCSIKEVQADIGNYMKSVARMGITETESSSTTRLPTIPQERLEEISAISSAEIVADAHEGLTSDWLPSQILGGPEAREKIERTWVGTYVIGKDYWNDVEEEDANEKEARKARFTADDTSNSWYEMPVPKASRTEESTYLELKKQALKKIEELKGDMDKEFRYKREQRVLLAAAARSKPKPFEEWTDSFKLDFKEVAKAGEFSHEGTHMSMANADKWLENASILDHRKLTLIHTGFCFLASGGSRNRGLSFTEFTYFLQMISATNGMPLRDISKRLEVCLRKAAPAD